MSSPESHPQSAPESASNVYDYYFTADRPERVTRLIAHKHHSQLVRACGGRKVDSVLEIGPGEGWVGLACRAEGISYTGVEASETGARLLRDRGLQVEVGSVPPLPSSINPVDLVYASHVIEHLPSPAAVVSLLKSLHGVLRAGGTVALAFPDARRLGIDFWDCDYTHTWPSTLRRIRQAAADAGFDIAAAMDICLHLEGAAARALQLLGRLFPYALLARVDPAREQFWYRGKMLLAPEKLVVLTPQRNH